MATEEYNIELEKLRDKLWNKATEFYIGYSEFGPLYLVKSDDRWVIAIPHGKDLKYFDGDEFEVEGYSGIMTFPTPEDAYIYALCKILIR